MSAAELFAGAGQKAGIEVWRIEALKPVKNKEAESGRLCTGDSYIVLHSIPVKSGGFDYNLHFWLGEESSQDEKGCAALMTIELDRFLGDKPVQFREVQGAESPEFLQCFDNGVQYLAGGVESGFAHVERDSWPTRLLHVKGRRAVRVLEVPLNLSSLNSGDVFILDAGLTLYQWTGKDASRAEKAKGLDIALAIKDEERGGRAALVPLAEGDATAEAKAFFALLGWTGAPDKAAIKSAEDGGADEAAEAAAAPRLFRARSGGAVATADEVQARPLEKSLLATNAVFALVAGGCTYAWVGKGAAAADKAAALTAAGAAAALCKLPASAPQKVVKEGTEPPMFKTCFFRWSAPPVLAPAPRASASASPRAKETVDVEALVRSAKAAAADSEPAVVEQPGSGELAVWRIEDFERAPVPPAQYGQFYAGDSYVILYKYKDANKRDAAFIYFWQGRDSSQDERAAAALQAKALDDSMGGYPVQVRVVQGKEPGHFHGLFGGRMVVHAGGHPSGFKNAAEADAQAAGSQPALYHVRGSCAADTHAVQVSLAAASLNSGDCFVLLLPGKSGFAWQGRFASPSERTCAAAVAAALAPLFKLGGAAVATVEENAEPAPFWAALGGKADYPACAEGRPPAEAPRLFQLCDAAAGGRGVRVEEIFSFGQDDLCDDDVMLLDAGNAVFLWVGRGATANEKEEADALAQRYVASAAAADGRDKDTPVIKVQAGCEPGNFTAHFRGWDPKQAAAYQDPGAARAAARAEAEAQARAQQDKAAEDAAAQKAAALMKAMDLKEAAKKAAAPADEPAAAAPAAAAAPSVTIAPGSKTFALADLRTMRATDGIDVASKEAYLSDADFKAALGMDKAAFAALPKWKAADAKKKAGIF